MRPALGDSQAAVGVIGITQIVDWRSFLAFVDTRYVPEIQFIPQGYSTRCTISSTSARRRATT
ncbi:MAG: hypothetical protein U0521_01420 [Anaerolineae bacterium]